MTGQHIYNNHTEGSPQEAHRSIFLPPPSLLVPRNSNGKGLSLASIYHESAFGDPRLIGSSNKQIKMALDLFFPRSGSDQTQRPKLPENIGKC